MDFRSFFIEGIDGEFHFEPKGGVDDDVGDEARNRKLGKSSKDTRKRKHIAESSGRETRQKARKVPPQASKDFGDPSDPLDVDSYPDFHEFPSTKELKDSADYHWVVAHMTPPSWKQLLKEISLEKLYNIHDKAYIRQVILDNVLNSKTRKLLSTLTKARDSCDVIHEREREKDKAYAELEMRLHDEYSRLVLEEKKWINYDQTLAILRSKVEGILVACLAKAALFHGRCSALEEVASLKEPFELENMPFYRHLSKKDFDQAGDNLVAASCPFLVEDVVDPYALLEVLVLKKPKSLRPKPAPSSSKPSSLKAPNQTS
nr:hypothetical protein [Tanacetum cinerariifolium]